MLDSASVWSEPLLAEIEPRLRGRLHQGEAETDRFEGMITRLGAAAITWSAFR